MSRYFMRNAIAEDGKRYRSPSIGEVFRNAGGIDVPESIKDAARGTTQYGHAYALMSIFERGAREMRTRNSNYDYYEKELKALGYRLDDIKLFVDILSEGMNEAVKNRQPLTLEPMAYINRAAKYAGIFLSAAINKVIKADDSLELDISPALPDTGQLLLNDLGMRFEQGTLILNGTVGQRVGWAQSGGKIVVNGDAEGHAAEWMSGGELVINGDLYDDSCLGMHGGVVKINGNVDPNVSFDMQSADSIGKIFVNGREVVP
jgi:hypothetical protein